MIKVYVDGQELDLFEDEGIQLNRSVKNLSDISAVYASFTQQFTVPASPRNNQIFQHYYRDDLQASISSLKRLPAFLTLNGRLFETGGVQIEGASVVNGKPRDYKIGFYGNVSRIREFVGEDTLKDLDLSAYDHSYEAVSIIEGFGSDSTGGAIGVGGDSSLIYPPFSAVRNWTYNSTNGSQTNNIAYLDDGITAGVYFYEPKPALQVTKILDAIESRYGVTFSGSFLTSAPFSNLYMWLHNREGYTFEGVDDVLGQGTVIEPATNVDNSGVVNSGLSPNGTEYSYTSGTWNGTRSFTFSLEFSTLSDDCFVYLYENGVVIQSLKATATGTPYTFNPVIVGSGLNNVYEIKYGRTTANLTVNSDLTISTSTGIFATAGSLTDDTADQGDVTYAEQVVIANLIPDMKVTDFLNGLIKMYNLIVTSTDGETFTFQPYNDFYAAGDEVDLSRWLDTREIEVEEIPRYGALEFKYNESDQVLQKRFRQENGRGYGDLVARFNFDQDDAFTVDVPFDLPFTELLTDDSTGTSFTDFTVYKSIEVNESGEGSSYYGAPVLFYYSENINISATPISFVDESDVETEIVLLPLCETVTGTSIAGEAMTFSEEINPYLLDVPSTNLYTEYWSDFITNTYNQQAKMYKISAYINMGLYSRLSLNDTILWKGRKYIINNMSTNFKTGKTDFELITKL